MTKGNEEIIYKRDSNTYFLDANGTEHVLITNVNLTINATTADPASPVIGEIWYRSDV